MAQPYVGEIRMFAGNFAPAGWMFCEGQLLPISENETLFQLIGTTYGGDGESTFALPDLRGRIPVHQGSGFILAETGGSEEITLTVAQIPSHSHPFLASKTLATNETPAANVLGQTEIAYFGDESPFVAMAACITSTGGSQPHSNFQPYLCVDFIISLFGIFPSPT
jgi:microcystin-dependent protein